MSSRTSEEIRKGLSHPIIDADGHQLEFEPLVFEYFREVLGKDSTAKLEKIFTELFGWYGLSREQRRQTRAVRPPWGLQANNADHLAACLLPGLFRQRMDLLGIDFGIIYPTLGTGFVRFGGEFRSAACRALNRYYADAFRDHADRLAPAALIPMTTPAEAIAELDFAVKELGFKVAVIDCAVPRPVEALAAQAAAAPPNLRRFFTWLDTLGVDSEHDYDPMWKRFLELGVAPTAHQAGMWGSRTSISNYAHNHIGMFGSAGEALCKSLFLAGVTFRFPELKIGFLEGGAGWACSLFGDLIEHWERRSGDALSAYDPTGLKEDELKRLLRQHGGPRIERLLDEPLEKSCRNLFLLSGWVPEAGWKPRDPQLLDEFHRCPIKSEDDIRDHFAPNFFFGCEAEDASVGWALNAGLNVLFGSDIGHWDVPDMTKVVAEAYEQVEHGHITDEGFKNWVFSGPVKLHGGANPNFFKGTILEREAAAVLQAEAAATRR